LLNIVKVAAALQIDAALLIKGMSKELANPRDA
jgi:hypothetical protein